MGAGIISGWQSLVFAQPPPGEDVGPLCPQCGAARVTRGQARHMARSGRGQGEIFWGDLSTEVRVWTDDNDNDKHTFWIAIFTTVHYFPAPLWNKFWLFPPGDRGQLGHWGPLLCSRLWGPGSLLSLLITSEPFLAQLWVVSSLCRYQWSPGPDHTPGMTLNTLDTTQTFQKRFSIRSLVIRADIWASHFSYSPIVSFLRYRSIVKTKTSTQTFHATLSSRRLQTAVVRLWPRTHPVDIGAFLLRLQE